MEAKEIIDVDTSWKYQTQDLKEKLGFTFQYRSILFGFTQSYYYYYYYLLIESFSH